MKKLTLFKYLSILFVCLIALGMASPSTLAASQPHSPPQGQFKVTSIDMAVSPQSIAGLKCGTFLTVTYKATFHLASNGPGGTIQFNYTVNNGRGQTPASLKVAPGKTLATFTFTWSGKLPADHVYPGLGGVMTSSPNQLTSPLVEPMGQCKV